MDEKKIMTARQVWISKKIYWIRSYKALLKYISLDYKDIFKPIIKKETNNKNKTGVRYFIKEENVDRFVKMFENSELK